MLEFQLSIFMTKKKKPSLKLAHWFEEDALKYGLLIEESQSKFKNIELTHL